jgi:hypothetical protein
VTFVAVIVVLLGMTRPAAAQQPWSSMPGACASTDNNFFSGTPSADYPVARFIVPGGAFTFNRFHDGYIAVICHVDNPRISSLTTQRWNQLQVTYRDPDGLQRLGGYGTEYQAYAELVRVHKITGAWSRIATFDSNLQCAGTSTSCQGDNTVKNHAVRFSHTFDFENYTYAVYGRLYRALAIYNLRPALYQVRLQVAPLVTSPTGTTTDTITSQP